MKSIKWSSTLPIFVCLVTLALLLFFVAQLINSEEYFNNEAMVIAENATVEYTQTLDDSVRVNFRAVESMAAQLSSLRGMDAYDSFGAEQVEKHGMVCLQFLKDGAADYRFGEGVGSSTADGIVSLVSSNVGGCSEIYNDLALGVPCVAVFYPVSGNTEINGVIAYYAVSDTIKQHGKLDDHVRFYCLAQEDGTILESSTADGFVTDTSHDIYSYLQNISGSKDVVDRIRLGVQKRISETHPVSINAEDYVISCVRADCFGTECSVYCIYSVRDLLTEEYTHYDRMIGAAVGLLILTLIIMVAFIVTYIKGTKQAEYINEYDPVLGCNTFNRFVYQSAEILASNKFSNYAFIYINVNRFSYLKEHFEPQKGEDLLIFLSNIIKKTTDSNESYGHVVDDRFVRLVHFSDMQELSDKIRLMQVFASNFKLPANSDYTVRLTVGVYIIDRDKDRDIPVDVMIERASIAQKMDQKQTNMPFVVFDATLQSDYAKEAEIESKMDSALKNREFKVFYQPKYNISSDHIDGAEALVRWYDEKQNLYVGPDQFIPLFEVNGFISRLDRYVFTEVCTFLDEAVKRGEKVVPISVNVSRVSATQNDFIEYYTKVKESYTIPNKFITLEFTESFACESNETIGRIVSTLASHGFMTSIDDFGSGYSSLSALKELQMDELKLDKFFIKPGTDGEKDETLLKSVIQLGKSFGMKVTQEGIETSDDFNHLVQLGCDVIQGYYYSRPLPLSDFIDFIAGDTSLRGIANKRIGRNK